MDVERDAIGTLEHLHVLERHHPLALAFHSHLSSVVCLLSSEIRSFGAWLEPRYIFGAGRLVRPVSYYAFFKGWLLLSQPPGCLGLPTSFPT